MTQAEIRPRPDDDEIFLVDGSGYIFRAYYAVPQNLTNPQGVPVGAVLGFCNMMVKLLKDLRAPYIAVIFDAARKNFRYDIYPEYKANRDETPADLIPQFGLIREATRAFGIPALELEGFEADDLIAAYAREALAQGKKVTIVGSDKDLMQLMREGVRMYEPIKGRYLTLEDVHDKFGVTPDKVTDVQALVGDSSDNVPGVPGIGVKTAAQLINEYGSLENLLAKTAEIKQPKRRDALIEHTEIARISKQLVTLRDDVPLPLSIEALHAHDPNTPALNAFLASQGFRSVMTRLGQNPTAQPEPTATKPATIAPYAGALPAVRPQNQNNLPPTTDNQYELIQDIPALEAIIKRAYETGLLAVDTETTGLTPAKAKLVGICLSCELGRGYYIPLTHRNPPQDLLGGPAENLQQIPLAEALALLKPVLEDPRVLKIGHNMKYDWQMIAQHGVKMSPVDDTMLMSYVLDGSNHGHGMDELAELFFGHKNIAYEDVTGKGKNQITFDLVPLAQARDYAAEDAEITLRLYHILKPRLAQEQCVRVYEDIERPIIPVIAEMELAGIKVDTTVLRELSHEFGKKLMGLEQDIYQLAGHEFNVASPKQMGVVLFEELGLPGGSKTKGGDWSTAADVLDELSGQGHEIIEKIQEWRQLSKLKSTYTDTLQEQINPATGRVHTSFHMTGTNTGRLSSSDPNLQNIPIRTEEGRRIRRAFVAEPGYKLLSVDYSQVELRLAAELAGVKALQQAFRDHVDIHALTASQVFGVPLDQVTPDLRRSAKAVNFGIIYGISGWGLAKQLGVTPGEANQFIQKYLKNFQEIQYYMEARKDEARTSNYVKTLYGRKCMVGNIQAKNQAQRNFAERQAINAPLQGTAADIMKIAMARMPQALRDANLKARILLQVHDELLLEVPDDEIQATADLVRYVMESVADIGVPLEAEAGWADNWAEAH
ncbi:MAG: DNA polymerase I [Alphaproteobacteria bacterium]|nr:DNA polymerase I [Alphaproteobacteria bacterium]